MTVKELSDVLKTDIDVRWFAFGEAGFGKLGDIAYQDSEIIRMEIQTGCYGIPLLLLWLKKKWDPGPIFNKKGW